MKLEINKIVTLGNNEEYLIVDKVEKDGNEYYYVAQVNEDETDIKDNYKRVLQGVSVTSANQIPENFITLLEQYEAAGAYEKLFEEFVDAFAEVGNSYKQEFEKPVAPEVVANLKDRREEVVELSTRYIKK